MKRDSKHISIWSGYPVLSSSLLAFFYFMCIDSFQFSFFSFLSQFYRQDAKYDMFLSPKMNNFFHTTNFRMSIFSSG